DAPRDANLGWKSGDYADSHDVYFGTDYNDVRDANTAVTLGVFKGNQPEIVYDLNLLDLDTTYYWRIDEVNDSNDFKWKGKVWRFTAVDFLIIDDMEDYDQDTKKIWYKWIDTRYQYDLTGSRVELGERPLYTVHRGDKVMRYAYDTDLPTAWLDYAEAWLTLSGEKKNWTREDVKILLLFFQGKSTNDANDTEQMYVSIEDTSGTYAEIRYGDYLGEDMNDIREPEWHGWHIALKDFNDSNYAEVPNDVDLEDVNRLYIGFGDRRNPVAGGAGEVLFDDIRLNLPVCLPDIIKPVGDFTGRRGEEPDCIVDLADVGYVADYWLMTDVNLVGQVQKPDDANLLGWWKLDDGTGGTATDSSSYNNSGTIETIDVNVWWVTGRADVNYALEFDGGRVLVPDGGAKPELRPEYRVSVCAWVYHYEGHDESSRIVVKGKDNKETYVLDMGDEGDFGFFVRDDVKYKSYTVSAPVWQDEWLHLAGSYDGDSNTVKGYLNGLLIDLEDDANFVFLGKTLSQDVSGLAIGNRSDANDKPFVGIIDDVRIYDYALAEAEVMWLASDGTGYTALMAPANLYDSEAPGQQAINYRDMAVLIDHWLEEKKWP
ncbi:MAG: LamG domain-containing protein, partial [Planctomycetota bacterium]